MRKRLQINVQPSNEIIIGQCAGHGPDNDQPVMEVAILMPASDGLTYMKMTVLYCPDCYALVHNGSADVQEIGVPETTLLDRRRYVQDLKEIHGQWTGYLQLHKFRRHSRAPWQWGYHKLQSPHFANLYTIIPTSRRRPAFSFLVVHKENFA